MEAEKPMTREEEEQLVSMICSGGEGAEVAIETLLLTIGHSVVEYYSRRFGIDDGELLTSLFVHLCGSKNNWAKLRTWNGTASLKTWLGVVTGRLCLDQVRKEKREKKRLRTLDAWCEDPAKEELTAPESRVEAKLSEARLLTAMQGLSERDRLVISLSALDGLSMDEVAITLQISTNAANVLKTRAMKKLSKLLSEGVSDATP